MDDNPAPRGVPTVTYLRVLNPEPGQGDDVQIDGSHVTIMEPGKVICRYDSISLDNCSLRPGMKSLMYLSVAFLIKSIVKPLLVKMLGQV